ncbi:MAG: class I SAM-dependent methyltransferase [Candidatus Deferrimicrobiaceae bacterium]
MRPCATGLEPELRPNELKFLIDTLKEKHFTGKYLEIGTAAGGTLCQMMTIFKDIERPQFVVVDPMKYFPNQFEIVKENLKNHVIHPDTIDFRIKTSFEAFFEAQENGEQFDFIFIDGAHKIRYVMQDLRWTRLLNEGGILMMHDYSSKYRGVLLAANHFLRRYRNYQVIGHVHTLLAIRKTGRSPIKEVNLLDRFWAWLLSPVLQVERSVTKRLKKWELKS